MAVVETEGQHEDCNDTVGEGEFDPSLLRIAEQGDQREGNCSDDHVSESGHAGAEQVDDSALIGVAGHQGSHRCIRQVERGVYNGGAEVIGDKYIDCLDKFSGIRYGKQ